MIGLCPFSYTEKGIFSRKVSHFGFILHEIWVNRGRECRHCTLDSRSEDPGLQHLGTKVQKSGSKVQSCYIRTRAIEGRVIEGLHCI